MKLNGHTKSFAVLGYPIGHSLSPIMHNASIKALNYNGIYLAYEVHPNHLNQVIESMSKMGFLGINLTVPHKETAYYNLEYLDKSAELFKAVNTISFEGDHPVGYNTDGQGFLASYEDAFGTFNSNQNVFIIGCGGAGRTIALQIAIEGTKKITLADIDVERMQKLKNEILLINNNINVECTHKLIDQIDCCRSSSLIIQASPIGMNANEKSLLPSEAFHNEQNVFDLIYMYPETDFLKTAKSVGANVVNGLGMLLHQGANSFKIWTGNDPDIDSMYKALSEAVYGK